MASSNCQRAALVNWFASIDRVLSTTHMALHIHTGRGPHVCVTVDARAV